MMWVKQCHKPSPSHHHVYRWYVYHSQIGGLRHCFTHSILYNQPFIWIYMERYGNTLRLAIINHPFGDLGIPHDLGNPKSANVYWLVVWNMNFMTFHSVGNSNPN